MGTDIKDVILNYLCPSAGVILANAVFSAPISSLQKALKDCELGDLNPMPWAFMTGNCVGWVTYSFLTQDIFVFLANAPGILISIWLNYGAVKLQYLSCYESSASSMRGIEITNTKNTHEASFADDDEEEEQEEGGNNNNTQNRYQIRQIHSNLQKMTPHERLSMSVVCFWIFVLTCISFIPMTHDVKTSVIGLVNNLNLIIFFGAPLSTIRTVIATKCSASIHSWLMITSTLNAAFWGIYGMVLLDFYIIVPNMLGLLFGIIQILLSCWFPKNRRGGSVCGNARNGTLIGNNIFENSSLTSDESYEDIS